MPLSTRTSLLALLALMTLTALPAAAQDQRSAPPPAPAQPPAAGADAADWRAAEKGLLSDHAQLTFPNQFVKAGEAYFNPQTTWIIFQAIPVPEEGREASNFYSMYVAKLTRSADGRISGIDTPIQVSAEGSANTCGWFHPKQPWRIIFGSTLVAPANNAPGGYQRGTSKYRWQFPTEMELVTRVVPEIFYDDRPKITEDVDWRESDTEPTPLFVREGYDAECSYSPDGRHIVFASVDPETLDSDIFVLDTKTNLRRPLVVAKGYDGGPFFSPDAAFICYRSDRRGDDLLQVFVAELVYSDDGALLGVRSEHAVTSNQHVNWAPFFHPSGEFIIYTTSEQGHQNYEVYASELPIGASSSKAPDQLRRKRITFAPGFDGLPVFSANGGHMMWTSQRGPKLPTEERPSSQLWIATVGNAAP